MNIIQAARAMREGKRVRRKVWDTYILQMVPKFGNGVYTTNLQPAFFVIDDLLADDWEIVEGEG